jgi:predicted lipoprotein with Yx(FWY)xxD motif
VFRRTLLPFAVLSVLTLAVTATPGSGAGRSRGALVKSVFNSKLKKTILVTSSGLTLYGWTADSGGTPTCYNDPPDHCSKAWPPLTTVGTPRAGHGVKASLLGKVKRKDGIVQVTYKNIPLYRDAGAKGAGLLPDKKPGDVNGEGFASLWFAITPAGRAA